MRALLAAALLLTSREARAELIEVAPADGYAKIEAAKAGDEVVLAPGTYAFRVHLTQKGTADKPIVIRAKDPANPPRWDLGSTLVEDAPGSYKAGDRGRGCWQLSGAEHVRISGIVFTHCRTAQHHSAGIRYYNGAKNIFVKDSVFRENDNGLTGGTQDSEITVEHCEFDRNGNLAASASAPTHNIYVYGGTFRLRYSFVHDPVQGQNFHVRAHTSALEYNWFARARSYEGDLMSDDDVPPGPSTQTMLFRGNVVLQGNPSNKSQVIALYNDGGLSQLTLRVEVVHNTFVLGFPNSNAVHLAYESADTTTMTAEISNNVIASGRPFLSDKPAIGTATGTNNWMITGTAPGPLAGTIFGATAPFRDAANKDFTLAAGSNALNAASGANGMPVREYFQNETVARQYRVRGAGKDIGAFESSTTGEGIGPYGTPPPPGNGDGGGPSPGANDAGGSSPGATPDKGTGASDGGCGCRAAGVASGAPLGLLFLFLLAARRLSSRLLP